MNFRWYYWFLWFRLWIYGWGLRGRSGDRDAIFIIFIIFIVIFWLTLRFGLDSFFTFFFHQGGAIFSLHYFDISDKWIVDDFSRLSIPGYLYSIPFDFIKIVTLYYQWGPSFWVSSYILRILI